MALDNPSLLHLRLSGRQCPPPFSFFPPLHSLRCIAILGVFVAVGEWGNNSQGLLGLVPTLRCFAVLLFVGPGAPTYWTGINWAG